MSTQAAAISLLVPDLPDANALRPWLEEIDRAHWYTNFGALNQRLCEAICELARARAAITCTNCTAAITLWLRERLGAAGALVALPAYTFVGSAQAVIASGNVPFIMDVDADNWQLSPAAVSNAAASHEIAAVLPVAALGAPCDLAQWQAFARDSALPVLIDAAAALSRQHCGEGVDVAFSLHATKALAAGEGGALASLDVERIARLRQRSNFGIGADGLVGSGGENAKLSEYHAAVALASLAQREARFERRLQLLADYRQQLAAHCANVRLAPHLHNTNGRNGAITLLPVLLPPPHRATAIQQQLAAHGIESRRWYCPPLHQHPFFANLPRQPQLPVAEMLGRQLLGLPFHLFLRPHDIERVCTTLASALVATPSQSTT